MASKKHTHLWDIPSKYFPKKSKAKIYRTEVLGFIKGLGYTNIKLQHAAKIAAFNIRSAHQPSIHADVGPTEVFRSVGDFVYHYENYCYRLFSFRERVVHFLNVAIPIGYEERDVKIDHLLINPTIKLGGFASVLEKFRKNNILGKIITDRHTLTHRLYYGKNDSYLRPSPNGPVNKKWFKAWEKEIEIRAKMINEAELIISRICNEVATKFVNYKKNL
jgi:hypothetical protein